MYGSKTPMTFGVSTYRKESKSVQKMKFKEGWKMKP